MRRPGRARAFCTSWVRAGGLAGALAFGLAGSVACNRKDPSGAGGAPPVASSVAPLGLAPDLGNRVLAKVGDRTITLADYAAVLEGMDRFDRLRYQTADRRKQLLEEMIQVELLAREAERRGLAEKPETREMERQILRDAVLEELRAKQPKLEEFSQVEVRAYYDAHHGEFKEPERRRISHLAFTDAAQAAKVLALAVGASPKAWGELVQKYGDASKTDVPPELAGDLGFVTPPSAGKTDNPRVPESVRAAAFEIADVGKTLERVVADGKTQHVVRLIAKNDAHDRTFEEAERTIRVRMLQERFEAARAALEKELAQKYPVKIDEAALAKVSVPAGPGKP